MQPIFEADGDRLGPDRAFIHVLRDSREGHRIEGCRSWEGGNRIPTPDNRADGVFAGWTWDGASLNVYTDRLGLFPLFAWVTSTQCCISPSLAVLIERGAPRTLDIAAIGTFLRLGYFLDDDTPFSAIRAVPAVRSMRWSNGGVVADRWTVPIDERSISRSDAIDEYVELFRESVAKRLPSPGQRFVIPLSGGADSRHILLELMRRRQPPAGAITATRWSGEYDVPVASRLTARMRIPHTLVPGMIDAGWSQELRKNRLTSFCADELVWTLPVADHMAQHSQVVYDGLMGDLMSGQEVTETLVRGMRANRIDELLAYYMGGSHEDVLKATLRPSFLARIPAAAVVDRVADGIRQHLDRPNPDVSFYLAQHQRREIVLSPFSIMGRLNVHTPYADRDLFDFLFSLPPELLLGGRFHVDTIHRAFPEHAAIPFGRDIARRTPMRWVHRARRIPHRLRTRVTLGPRCRDSEYLALKLPASHPRAQLLPNVISRLTWMRQVELVARGDLQP